MPLLKEERVSTVNVLVGQDTEAQSRAQGGEETRQIFREEKGEDSTQGGKDRVV